MDIVSYPQIPYRDGSRDEIVELGLAGERLPSGQYAFGLWRDGRLYLARDPLGCNKLFFGRGRDGETVYGSRLERVWACGIPLGEIASCPPGRVVEVAAGGPCRHGGPPIHDLMPDPELDEPAFAEAARDALDEAFGWLARTFEGSRFVVALSGGLDSSVIASFAARHLPGAAAASFSYLDAEDLARHARGAPAAGLDSASDDFRCAAQVAKAIGLPLIEVLRPGDAVPAAVAASVRLCQDWRDFNVHCATVNLFLAQDLRARFAEQPVVVLTGDLMNEFVCDYRDEQVGETVYYRVPRIAMDKRRKHFVRGLDAGDREIGVFGAFGLTLCQPFAVLAERFMRIPGELLESPDLKWTLNGPLLAPEAAPHVNRAKTRAQVGGKDLGTLGIYHRLGIGEEALRRAWRDMFPGESADACDGIIQFGRYRVPRFAG